MVELVEVLLLQRLLHRPRVVLRQRVLLHRLRVGGLLHLPLGQVVPVGFQV